MMCIYLNSQEMKAYASVDDKEIDEYLQKARRFFKGLLIRKFVLYRKKGWLNKPQSFELFSIYWVMRDPEVQVVNFPNQNKAICTEAPKEIILTYLIALLYGYQEGSKPLNKAII